LDSEPTLAREISLVGVAREEAEKSYNELDFECQHFETFEFLAFPKFVFN
jgi:hypothetical protein